MSYRYTGSTYLYNVQCTHAIPMLYAKISIPFEGGMEPLGKATYLVRDPWLRGLDPVDWPKYQTPSIPFFMLFLSISTVCEHLLNKYPCNREIYSTEIYCKTHLETSSIASLSSSSSLNNLIFASESLILWNKKVNTGKNDIYLNGSQTGKIKMLYV